MYSAQHVSLLQVDNGVKSYREFVHWLTCFTECLQPQNSQLIIQTDSTVIIVRGSVTGYLNVKVTNCKSYRSSRVLYKRSTFPCGLPNVIRNN